MNKVFLAPRSNETSYKNFLSTIENGIDFAIVEPYINFKKTCGTKRGKSDLWQERVKMWKERPEAWHESYRYRVLVEGIFSAIKRKQQNWLRARTDLGQDIELLLKCLVYNLTIIGKYT